LLTQKQSKNTGARLIKQDAPLAGDADLAAAAAAPTAASTAADDGAAPDDSAAAAAAVQETIDAQSNIEEASNVTLAQPAADSNFTAQVMEDATMTTSTTDDAENPETYDDDSTEMVPLQTQQQQNKAITHLTAPLGASQNSTDALEAATVDSAEQKRSTNEKTEQEHESTSTSRFKHGRVHTSSPRSSADVW
jgi:hypothetical protein